MSQSEDVGDGNKKAVKKTPNDFIFGKVIGEGSYSTVYLAKEVETGTEFAIKVLEKRHIMREKKTQYVMREKEVLMKMNHPFIIRLFYTFQDSDRLYFVLNYADRGELLDYLHKLSSFDLQCTRWYTAEIVSALEYMHSLNFIHRDLKPENILLNKDMHIQITDFGSAKILSKEEETKPEEGIHSGHKAKVSKPRKGGRTPLEKDTTDQAERQPLLETSSVQGALDLLDHIDENNPFELIYLFQTKASLCYGCRTKFSRETEQNDLIIRHYCDHEYSVQGQRKTKWLFAYFHLRSSCVCRKFPDFKKEMLKISKESKDILPQEVRQKLRAMGIGI